MAISTTAFNFVIALILVVCLIQIKFPILPLSETLEHKAFKIAAFSDLHYGENEDSFGIPQDGNSSRLMYHVLDVEKPNLVILNGDLVTGENTFATNSSHYVDKIVEPLVKKNYKWASTYGNHDSKFNLTRESILAREQKYTNSYTQSGPTDTDGITNYILPLYAARTGLRVISSHRQSFSISQISGRDRPVALLYFLDSRGGSQGDPENNDNIPNFVSERTVVWLKESVQHSNRKWGVVPSLAFVHIPIQAFWDLQQNMQANVGGKHFPGLNADVPVQQQGNGAVGRNCCVYHGQDIPLMQTFLEMEGLHSIYSSHDHGDSWCGTWQNETIPSEPALNHGINYASNGRPFLCFTKHSGFGGYGQWNRGVRQIQLSFEDDGKMNVQTWVRMQDGKDHAQVITNVTLNNTYGQDNYPTTDGGYHPY